MNIALVGYRGTGKSTVGPALAAALAWTWLDADDEIERAAGKSIAAIFADEGESHFRDLESRELKRLVQLDRRVLSLGGGAVLRDENRAALSQACVTVWLTASPASIWQRVSSDAVTAARRPNLAGGGLAEIEILLAQRKPMYRACADVTIDTEGKSTPQVVAEILSNSRIAALRT